MPYAKKYLSPIGTLIMVCDGEYLVGLRFENASENANKHGAKRFAEQQKYVYGKMNDCNVFALTEQWLDEYFCGRQPNFLPPIKIDGTPFFKRVAEIVLSVPYGHTMTYGQIAAELNRGKKMSAQAVGGAVGGNPLCIVVPCHRVVGAKSLVGYGGGLDNKIALLSREGVDLTSFGIVGRK